MRMDILKSKYEDLIVKEMEINKNLSIAAGKGLRPREEVLLWLARVSTVKIQVKRIENSPEEKSTKCFNNRHPHKKHLKLVREIIEKVDKLQEFSCFPEGLVDSDELFDGQLPNMLSLLATPELVGDSIQKTLNEVWEHIMDPEVGIIGIYGMGGVGKSVTMMTIHNWLATTKIFNKIVWVTMSKDWSLEDVQNNIAVQLRVHLPSYEDKMSRAARLLEYLNRVKKFLIIFDDMWEHISLEAVGIPLPGRDNGNKILLASRSPSVCWYMKTDKSIKLDVLPEEEAWDLFVSKAGGKVLTPEILPLARQLVYKCDYLPILIISLGNAMRDEVNTEVWMKALKELNSLAKKHQGVSEKNLTFLRFSYRRLKKDATRNCFLYCAFFPEDYLFNPEELIRYWMAEDFIHEDGDIVVQMDEGREILRELKDANMLETFTKRGHELIKMHDLLRDLAIRIMEKELNFFVKAGQELKEIPPYSTWGGYYSRKVSLMKNHIEDLRIPKPYHSAVLSTLLLRGNPISTSAPNFFGPLPAIKVLDLSYSGIKELPSSLSKLLNLRVLFLQNCKNLRTIPSVEKLKELRVLNLRGTSIKVLPHGMMKLVNLRSLDLSGTTKLEIINFGLLSSLICLEELQLQGSLVCNRDTPMLANCLVEMRSLKHLTILTLSGVSSERLLDTIMCLQEQNLKKYTINVYGSDEDFVGLNSNSRSGSGMRFSPSLSVL